MSLNKSRLSVQPTLVTHGRSRPLRPIVLPTTLAAPLPTVPRWQVGAPQIEMTCTISGLGFGRRRRLAKALVGALSGVPAHGSIRGRHASELKLIRIWLRNLIFRTPSIGD